MPAFENSRKDGGLLSRSLELQRTNIDMSKHGSRTSKFLLTHTQ